MQNKIRNKTQLCVWTYTRNSTIKCTKASSLALFRVSATGIKGTCLARSSVITTIVKDTKMTNC